MKKLLLALGILCFAQSFFAQTASKTCDTLILFNDRVLSVSIDSINEKTVFYKKCPSENPAQYRMGLRYLKGEASLDFFKNSPLVASENKPGKPKFGPIKKWIFKHKVKKLIREYSENQKVEVNYSIENGRRKSSFGTLTNITPHKLILKTPRKGTLEIERSNINYIKAKRGGKIAGSILAGTSLFLGIALLAFIMVVAFLILIFGGKGFSDAPDDVKKGTNTGCLIVVLLLAAGGAFLAYSKPTRIKNPFSGDWSVTEVIENPEVEVQDEAPLQKEVP